MKRRIAIVFLLLVLLASVAMAATPVTGRTRIYGYKDEIKTPQNKFAPYIIYLNEAHVENRYAEFTYIREDSEERHWAIEIVNADGEPREFKGGDIRIFLPYPSIWSESNQSYWKWTQRYAEKHYNWEYAIGYSADWTNGTDWFTQYIRTDYAPVRKLEEYGPRITMNAANFGTGFTLWIRCKEKK